MKRRGNAKEKAHRRIGGWAWGIKADALRRAWEAEGGYEKPRLGSKPVSDFTIWCDRSVGCAQFVDCHFCAAYAL